MAGVVQAVLTRLALGSSQKESGARIQEPGGVGAARTTVWTRGRTGAPRTNGTYATYGTSETNP